MNYVRKDRVAALRPSLKGYHFEGKKEVPFRDSQLFERNGGGQEITEPSLNKKGREADKRHAHNFRPGKTIPIRPH